MENNRSRGKGAQLAEPTPAVAQRGGSPRTEEAKASSRMNALRLAILSKEIVIPGAEGIPEETQEGYDRLLGSYVDHFQPEGPAEMHQIELAVGALWRYRRFLRAEARELLNHQRELDDSCNPDSNHSRTTIRRHRASVPGSQESESLQRHEDHLLRVYNRALNELARLQRPRLGNNRNAPIAVFVHVERRSGSSSDPQGARPRYPKQAAIPEDPAGKDKGPEEQMPSGSQRSPDQAARDGTHPPGAEGQHRELHLGPSKGKTRRDRLEASKENEIASGRFP